MSWTVLVTARAGFVERARSTVATAMAHGGAESVVVVDIDGRYRAYGSETVVALPEVARQTGDYDHVRDSFATLSNDDVPLFAAAVAARTLPADRTVVILSPGVLVTGPLEPLVTHTAGGLVALSRCDSEQVKLDLEPDVLTKYMARQLRPVPDLELLQSPDITNVMVVLGPDADRELFLRLVGDWRTGGRGLDRFVALSGARIATDAALLLAARRGPLGEQLVTADGHFKVGGRRVVALDATNFDVARPWLFDAKLTTSPSFRLSDHPELKDFLVESTRGWESDLESTSIFDDILRAEACRARLLGEAVPDLLGGAGEEEILAWATEFIPPGHPHSIPRYLATLRALRVDVSEAFPHVPGSDTKAFLNWARTYGVNEEPGQPALIKAAAEAERPPRVLAVKRGQPRVEGVNLVGYLSGELGLGESGRLVGRALAAAGVPASTFDVSYRISSRTDAEYDAGSSDLHDISLMCVNGGESLEVFHTLPEVLRGSYRIGMWYWEFEEFPKPHHVGFRAVNEVWAATDFIRDSIAAHSKRTPVITMMPPLPQRPPGETPALPERFGIDPERPWFLFTFDFLSLAPRKNPLGLIEAFTRAFPEATPDGPQLVIKTINADKASRDAEQLRFASADRSDVILIEEYLPNEERFVLVANCTAYVSLHKAEGLGLTIAEAMAWGRPVVVTAYGGPLQFANESNSYHVGYTKSVVPEPIGPYDRGLTWAEPDLDQAAAILREIVADPEGARKLGEQAALDIATLHSPEAAGARMAARLAEIRAEVAARKDAAALEARQASRATSSGEKVYRKVRRYAGRVKRRLQSR